MPLLFALFLQVADVSANFSANARIVLLVGFQAIEPDFQQSAFVFVRHVMSTSFLIIIKAQFKRVDCIDLPFVRFPVGASSFHELTLQAPE